MQLFLEIFHVGCREKNVSRGTQIIQIRKRTSIRFLLIKQSNVYDFEFRDDF